MPRGSWSTNRASAPWRSLLGTSADADDAVQEAWLRLTRSEPDAVNNLGGWLTTVVSRIALDMLRTRAVRNEQPLTSTVPDAIPESSAGGVDPADQAVLADAVATALLVVLDRLAPAERLAFALHDIFAVPFVEIGRVLGRSPAAAKQLAHRARRKVQQDGAPDDAGDQQRHRAVVEAFLGASRTGNLQQLIKMLHPDIVMEADARAVTMGARGRVEGPARVAEVFAGRALGARSALIDGGVGLVWEVDGRVRVAWEFAVEDGNVVHVEMLADPETIGGLEVVTL